MIVLDMEKGQLVIESEVVSQSIARRRSTNAWKCKPVQATRLFADKYAIEIDTE